MFMLLTEFLTFFYAFIYIIYLIKNSNMELDSLTY